MRWKSCAIGCSAIALAAGCGTGDDRQWMKVNDKYTTAEFQRDHAECSKSGKLDEACMRSRGWVDVRASKPEAPKDPEPYRAQPSRR